MTTEFDATTFDATEFDVIVIGAGSTGENVADRAVQGGLSTAIIEEDLVGGSCSYWACMPSKALLRSAEARDAALHINGAKQAVTGKLDVAAVLARRDKFTSNHDDSGQADWVNNAGITLLRGRGRLTGDRTVALTDDEGSTLLRARHAVVLCVGSSPALPPIPGLADSAPWTNVEATSATEVPESLLVLGGGAVGVELAQAWHSLGSRVQLIQRGDRVLSAMEPAIGERLTEMLRGSGIEVHTGASATEVARAQDGTVTVTLDNGRALRADELLVALGRTPGTEDVGVDLVGLTPGEPLHTDDTLTVIGVGAGHDANPWLYAAGDCTGRAALTHMGKYQARICGDVIVARSKHQLPSEGTDGTTGAYGKHAATADHTAVSQVVFTNPQAAAVGLTEQQARDRGLDVAVVEYEIGSVAGAALHLDGYTGYAKLVVDRGREVVVGASFLGPDVAELLHAATIAVVGEVPLSRLWHAVPAYPTISEVWLRLLEKYGL